MSSTEYTHFTNLAFDTLFARGPYGTETQIFDSSGNFSCTAFTATSAGTVASPSIGIKDGSAYQGLYLPSTGNLGIAVGGTKIVNVNSTGIQITGTLSATNFSGTFSGTSSGTNTGDVTIGTANGLSLASQAISMAAASSAATGVVSTGTQSFAGTKTFVTALAGSNVASASSSASGVVSTGTQSFAGIKTFVTQLIGKGTAAVNDAATGYIGEYITAESSGISAPTSGQYGDVANISLTAGDWDIDVNGEAFLNTATGLTDIGLGIGTVSGNSSTGQVAGINFHNVLPPTSNYNSPVTISRYRISISSTTVYYLKMHATYSGGSPQFRGRISARRAR